MVDGELIVDASIACWPDSARDAGALERCGYAAGWVSETAFDPFVALSTAAVSTTTITLGTSIAVALARSPMTTAASANHVQLLSGGRFILGIGSQVEAHIVRRFSMPWSRPAARMREYILALRAIWECWETGGPLDFRGDFYSHTLMGPVFSPGPNRFGAPPIYLSAVGPVMTSVASEVADGLIIAPLAPPSYIRDEMQPMIAAGRAGSDRPSFALSAMPFVATGATRADMDEQVRAVRARIAFYAATPSYSPIMEYCELEDLQRSLIDHARRGEWNEMTDLIDDEVLHAFAIVAQPSDVLAEIRQRYEGLVDRVTIHSGDPIDAEMLARIASPHPRS